jgi:hypothetical protein
MKQAYYFISALTLIIALVSCKSQYKSPISPSNSYTYTPTSIYTVSIVSTPSFTSTTTPTMSATSIASYTNTPTLTFTTTPVFSSTPILSDWDLSAGVTTLSTGPYSFGCVHLGAGAVVTINGGVTLIVQCFTLDAGATLTGVGTGYAIDSGPGQGLGEWGVCSTWYLASGGGHGGAGGSDCVTTGNGLCSSCLNGGAAYDDPIHPSQMGSPGQGDDFGYSSPPNSYGGALLKIVCFSTISNSLEPVTINGMIDMSGDAGRGSAYHHSGGGAGGTILLEASEVDGSGLLSATGGSSSTYGGGSGGGGIISLIENLTAFGGSLSVSGGSTYGNGSPGIITFSTPPSSGY